MPFFQVPQAGFTVQHLSELVSYGDGLFLGQPVHILPNQSRGKILYDEVGRYSQKEQEGRS